MGYLRKPFGNLLHERFSSLPLLYCYQDEHRYLLFFFLLSVIICYKPLFPAGALRNVSLCSCDLKEDHIDDVLGISLYSGPRRYFSSYICATSASETALYLGISGSLLENVIRN